ncbi:putative zinc carboxypeptidase [Rosellinia necatrix]|uniref:Putative zinc carboxypeptidase n=1 Tax=Rosellinia necatrix TaxID=77044 RepID=A0A1W2TU77_ROSNE|nr:putative zinc carboxypeptidase [Rosellinia necatrix]
MKGLHLGPILFTATICASVTPTSRTSSPYSGFKVFRVKTHAHASAVQEKLSNITFEQWNYDVNSHMDIVLAPSEIPAFSELGLEFDTMHEDLGASIAAESVHSSAWKRQAGDSSWFDSYHAYQDHVQYLESLHDLFADNSEIISSGYSYENRSLHGIHLWGAGGPGKPVVLYHGTVHAREWISTATTEYLAYRLVTGYNAGDRDARSALDKYDFYIIPVVNPDGFVYTQTTERLWRKNRQPGPGGSACYGRDINRNWEFAWDANPQGASTNPCSQTYRGARPSDAPENAGLDALVRRLRDGVAGGIKLYVDWHSYGQYILSPFGYKEALYAPELGRWTKAAQMASDAIRDASADRTTFTFGPSGATLYPTTGAAPDHVYSVGRAAFSYTIELRDTGAHGFVLPPELIRPTVEEQWAGQKVLWSLLDEEFFDGEGPA